jgi:AcrR family transcriptional regulator
MSRQRLSKETRKKLILQAAFEVISAKGFKSTTTKAVAEAAGVNEALIFQHFPTKQKLLEGVILEIINQQPVPIDKGPDDNETGFYQKLRDFERFFLGLNLKRPENLKIIMYCILEDYPLPDEFNHSKEGTFLRWFYDSLEKGKKEWGFAPNLDLVVSISMYIGGLIYFILLRISGQKITEPQTSFTDSFIKTLK